MLRAEQRNEKEAGDLLGTYLLQGWIMTDEICSVEHCSFPLMSSKDRSLQFCTQHDDLPNKSPQDHYQPKVVKEPTPVIDDMSDELELRRQRREQSSRASQLIGQKMLQRWALLNEHCPNPACYAVPLVRNPDTKQMYCVICENIILTEEEASRVEENKLKKQQEEKKVEEEKIQEKKIHKKVELTHSPPVQQQPEETKRQKIEYTSFVPPVSDMNEQECSIFSSESILSTLSIKMNELADRVKVTHDPKELEQLFKSIKQCAGAIQACALAGQAYDGKQ